MFQIKSIYACLFRRYSVEGLLLHKPFKSYLWLEIKMLKLSEVKEIYF